MLAPTMNYGPDQVRNVPVKIEAQDQCTSIVKKCIEISKNDWDSFETSWDFTRHPLVRCAMFSRKEMETDAKHYIRDMNYIEDAFTNWSNEYLS